MKDRSLKEYMYISEITGKLKKILGDNTIKNTEVTYALSSKNIGHAVVDGVEINMYDRNRIMTLMTSKSFLESMRSLILDIRSRRIEDAKPKVEIKPVPTPKLTKTAEREIAREKWKEEQRMKQEAARKAEEEERAQMIRDNRWHEQDMDYLRDHYFDNEIDGVDESLNEDYGKWFQTEPNDAAKVKFMINRLTSRLDRIGSITPEELWECVRDLAYINHSAFKVKPGMWDKYPDEKLEQEDYDLNKLIYEYKTMALGILRDYYLSHKLDISTDENHTMLLFRDPMTGVRQITFHLGKNSDLPNVVPNEDGVWDGVRAAHHYVDDDSYQRARFAQE